MYLTGEIYGIIIEKHNLHRPMLIMVLQINCFFFLSLKIAAKFSNHFGTVISSETSFGAVGCWHCSEIGVQI